MPVDKFIAAVISLGVALGSIGLLKKATLFMAHQASESYNNTLSLSKWNRMLQRPIKQSKHLPKKRDHKE